ncbi:MAG: HDOD domain-containing protein [Desulfovibrio sp.]|nr:HDOD domain-containing protein [Desulfovibrio sp.]
MQQPHRIRTSPLDAPGSLDGERNKALPFTQTRSLDDILGEMDRLVREDSASERRIRERERQRRSRALVTRAALLWDQAVQYNDPRNCFWEAVRTPALGQAVRDLLRQEQIPADPGPWSEPEADPQESIDAVLKSVELPESFLAVAEAMQSKVSNAARVAEAVRRDPALARLLLGVVNSPFYGVDTGVDSLQRAVAFAGFGEVSAAALALAAFRVLGQGLSTQWLSGYWRRSVLCGVLARMLAQRAGLVGQWYFASGLLHDVGGLAALSAAPGAYQAMVQAVRAGRMPLPEAEHRYLGISSTALGAQFLQGSWLPEVLPDAVIRMVEQRRSFEAGPECRILYVAEALTGALTMAWPGFMAMPPLEDRIGYLRGPAGVDLSSVLVSAGEQAFALAEGISI